MLKMYALISFNLIFVGIDEQKLVTHSQQLLTCYTVYRLFYLDVRLVDCLRFLTATPSRLFSPCAPK